MQDYLKEFRETLNLEDKFDQALLLDTMLFVAQLEQSKKKKKGNNNKSSSNKSN